MDDLVGQRIVMAVAQTAWEKAGDDGYTVNTFCTLAPLIDVEGNRLDEGKFPNCGLVWWLVRPLGRGYAEPGRLVTGRLVRAVKYSPDKRDDMLYQVEPESVDALRPKDMVEIVDLPTLKLQKIEDLVNRTDGVKLDHPPTYITLVRWKGKLYGPLRASSRHDEEGGGWRVSFTPDSPDSELLEIPAEAARDAAGEAAWTLDTEITHADQNPRAPRHDDVARTRCRYELIGAEAYDALMRGDYERLRLESAEQLVHALGKQLLTRKQQGELGRLLQELQERAAETLPDDPGVDLAARIYNRLVRQGKLTADIAHTLVDSGLFDKKLGEARDARVEKYLQERSAELEAKVQAEIAQRREEIDALRGQQEALEQELANARQAAQAELERELEARRSKADERLREERARIAQERAEIEQSRALIRKELAPLVADLRAHRDDAAKQMLTLAPLLSALGVVPGSGAGAIVPLAGDSAAAHDAGTADGSTAAGAGVAAASGARLALPSFVTARSNAGSASDPSEEQLFERFTAHAEARGFRYRPHDLRAFHLAAKTSDLTVLGGVSGTGKSSLPAIYAEALAGQDLAARDRFLHVGVSPGWLDPRDLLGHVNALSGGFQPAESGLYEQVVYAMEERAEKGGDSGLYVVCLDEMNLAHVEHYFAGFLQALSRPEGRRRVRCFEPGSVAPASPFARWPELDVPATMRFVGTVNFDETTRQLSRRLLDRANLIVLRPPELGAIPLTVDGGDSVAVAGAPVRERTVRSWVAEAPLEPALAGLVDSLRPHLQALGCPLTPRRYRSICRYVASAGPICSAREAFDMQVAQRVLPQIRGLYGRRARTALSAVAEIIEGGELPESRLLLEELREREIEVADGGELGEGAAS